MKNTDLYIVFSDRYLEGEIMNLHEMRREMIIAKYKKEYFGYEVLDANLKDMLLETIDELE